MSCSSDDPDVTRGSEVQFTTAAPARSSVSYDLNYDGAKFAIYGDMKLGGASSSNQNTIIFNGVPVTYVSSKWTYGQTQYWFPNHEHSFVAVYPADPAGASGISYQNNLLTFNYTLPAKFNDAQDLMVATHRRMYNAETAASGAPVALKFSHIMSRLNFSVKNDKAAETVRVTKLELEGVNKSGTYTIIPASLLPDSKQTDDYDHSWTNIANKSKLTADIAVNIPDNEALPLFPDNNALFVIPQPDNKDIKLRIAYRLIYQNGRTEDLTTVATTNIGNWEPGKVYNYSLTITPIINVIELTVTVTDWKEGTNDDVVVPRK